MKNIYFNMSTLKIIVFLMIIIFGEAENNHRRENILSRYERSLRGYRRQLDSPSRNLRQLKAQQTTLRNIRNSNSMPQKVIMPRIPLNELQETILHATSNVKRRFQVVEPNIFSQGVIQTPGSPGWFAAASAKTKVISKNMSHYAFIAEETTKILSERYLLTPDQIAFGLPIMDLRKTSLGANCPNPQVAFPCHPGKYRSYTGHCNNVQNPDWGNSNTAFLRILPPMYSDAIASPRGSLIKNGGLPSAREVSLKMHQGLDVPHSHITTLTIFFGEFIFHDLAHITQVAGHKGHRIKCCSVKSELKHPECMPIEINKSDPLFVEVGQRCMEYVRSSPTIRIGCTLGSREQINQVTSFLDGSAVYGSSEEESRLLRKFSGGELLTQKRSGSTIGKELLPAQQDNSQDCKNLGRSKCFKAGDIRVNDNLGLSIIHTLFMREHNRIARKLSLINSHWNDNQVFEETRRILTAQIQHITYNEFLPALLGEQVIDQYELRLLNDGFYTKYDINANPSIDNAVASAAFAFIFTMIPSKMERYSLDLDKLGSIKMSDTYFDPAELYEKNKFDEYLTGMISQNAQDSDLFVTNEMTNGVVDEAKEGMDFVAMLIQQGRDHGLTGYTEWRKACKLSPEINDFKDLASVMKQDAMKKLSSLYSSVHDIDLFTGGLAEKPLRGAVMGPTFACLLARQFYYLRKGDRYWYENDLPPSSFTKEQLDEIRKTSLARIVCDNGDKTEFVQPSSMIASDAFLNAFQYCSTNTIADMDFNKWKDNSRISFMPSQKIGRAHV